MYLRKQHIQEIVHAADDTLVPRGVPLSGHLLREKVELAISAFLDAPPPICSNICITFKPLTHKHT